MWTALATVYEGLQRLVDSFSTDGQICLTGRSRIGDAIQAHTRALLGADRIQTPTILTKLAALHTTLAGGSISKDAVGYHMRLLALGERMSGQGGSGGMGTAEMAGSYLAVAEYEMRDAGGVEGREGGEDEGRGDWALASQYLEKVASTNAPQRDKAEEMLRELRLREAKLRPA